MVALALSLFLHVETSKIWRRNLWRISQGLTHMHTTYSSKNHTQGLTKSDINDMTRQENLPDLFLESHYLFIHFFKNLGLPISRTRTSLIRDSLWFALDSKSIWFFFAGESKFAGESWFATNQSESIPSESCRFPENSSVIKNLIRTWIRKTSVRKVFGNPITFKVRSYGLSQSH